jgi:hypothetical protein
LTTLANFRKNNNNEAGRMNISRPAFLVFSLEVYDKSLREGSTVVLSGDSEFFKHPSQLTKE